MLRHPFDGQAWKHFDRKHPSFGEESNIFQNCKKMVSQGSMGMDSNIIGLKKYLLGSSILER